MILDKGYVRLVNVMGSDVDVVNAARASFNREVDTLGENDIKLINYLVKHRHDSVLRHCAMTFEVYAPLMVARQWWKHAVASSHLDDQVGWNEVSRRYVVEEPEYYIPRLWRSYPENTKQGSGGPIVDDAHIRELYDDFIEYADNLYHRLMDLGVAPEQARLALPANAMYVRWRWTTSLQSVLNFIDLRLGHGAQAEITQYAEVVADHVKERFPITTAAWLEHRVLES